MATSPQTYGVISEVIADAQAGQPTRRRKANTLTASLGTGFTAVLAGLAYWGENGGEFPDWTATVVFVVGAILTSLGVSRTKNGVTDSVAAELNDILARKIDANHDHGDVVPAAIPAVEPSSPAARPDAPANDTSALLAEARRLAGG